MFNDPTTPAKKTEPFEIIDDLISQNDISLDRDLLLRCGNCGQKSILICQLQTSYIEGYNRVMYLTCCLSALNHQSSVEQLSLEQRKSFKRSITTKECRLSNPLSWRSIRYIVQDQGENMTDTNTTPLLLDPITAPDPNIAPDPSTVPLPVDPPEIIDKQTDQVGSINDWLAQLAIPLEPATSKSSQRIPQHGKKNSPQRDNRTQILDNGETLFSDSLLIQFCDAARANSDSKSKRAKKLGRDKLKLALLSERERET